MRVVLFGATGMIGGGALIECLADDRVTAVRTIS
jgi:nucleoside-diphosphate-sugar epimerase